MGKQPVREGTEKWPGVGTGLENSWRETGRCRKRELQRESYKDRDRRGGYTQVEG